MTRFLGLVFFFCFAGTSSRADSFQAFSFNATLTGFGIAAGTLTLDETTGLFTGANLSTSFATPRPSVPSSYVFDTIYLQGYDSAGSSDDPHREYFGLDLDDPALSNPDELYTFNLEFQNSSLVGYGGGSVCSEAFDCPFDLLHGSAFIVLGDFNVLGTFNSVIAGTLTPISSVPPAVTPEPSSLWLLGTGLFGVGLMVSKRLGIGLGF